MDNIDTFDVLDMDMCTINMPYKHYIAIIEEIKWSRMRIAELEKDKKILQDEIIGKNQKIDELQETIM